LPEGTNGAGDGGPQDQDIHEGKAWIFELEKQIRPESVEQQLKAEEEKGAVDRSRVSLTPDKPGRNTYFTTYRSVHTGPNSQLGGLRADFTRPSYHASGLNMEPNRPGMKETARKITKTPMECLLPCFILRFGRSFIPMKI
jgi:hypothetical protein